MSFFIHKSQSLGEKIIFFTSFFAAFKNSDDLKKMKNHIKVYQNISSFYFYKNLDLIKKGLFPVKHLAFAHSVIFA